VILDKEHRFWPEASKGHGERGIGAFVLLQRLANGISAVNGRRPVTERIASQRFIKGSRYSRQQKISLLARYRLALAGRKYVFRMAPSSKFIQNVVFREQLVTADNCGRIQVPEQRKLHGPQILAAPGRLAGEMRVCRKTLSLLVALFASLLAACGPALQPAPTLPSDDPSFLGGTLPVKTGLDETSAMPPDTLSPGDILAVHFLGSADLDLPQTPVDRSGRVHLPLVGDVLVAGRTLSEAEVLVQSSLARFDRSPHVSINLVETRGRVAAVVGAVEHPGNIPLVGDARVADVLAAAGGPRLPSAPTPTGGEPATQGGDLDGARLVRNGAPLPIDFRLALGGDRRHNARVRPGDVIYVPPILTGRVTVLGSVNRPRAFSWRPDMRLTEALAEAEGLSRYADDDDVRVLRGGYANPHIYAVSAKDLLAGVRKDVVLAPGDVVYVSQHWFGNVGDVTERVVPAAALYFLYRASVR
jgi:polysaccharide biosynthesis/export protein